MIFAKNSDRAANECQPLTHVPRHRHRPGALAQCQYIAIPQVTETWEVIGARPYWLWGFETGVNEWGVAIGNEAVLSREPYEERALIGMDLVRLGLERGRTADEAVRVIGALVEEYGQGGSCEATSFRTYHNSFIVADPTTAWIVETAGRRWVARQVRDRAAISNLYTIRQEWDAASPGVAEYAQAQGWAGEPCDFAAAYQDPAADLRPRACRLDRARALLGGQQAPATVPDMQALLRDHYGADLAGSQGELPSICMHVATGRAGETASALVAHLRPGQPRELTATVWTAFGSPCLSVFRPVYPCAVGLPAGLDRGGANYDPDSPWWIFERLQRLVVQAPTLAPAVRGAFGRLEARFREEAAATEADATARLAAGDRAGALRLLRDLVNSTTTRAITVARTLTTELAARAAAQADPAMQVVWADLNAAAGLPGAVPAASAAADD